MEPTFTVEGGTATLEIGQDFAGGIALAVLSYTLALGAALARGDLTEAQAERFHDDARNQAERFLSEAQAN